MPWSLIIGRSLAFCVHPYAAWGRLTTLGRALVVSAYVGIGYAIALAVLFAI